MINSLSKEERVKMVFDLYEKFGHADYIGEPVSQIEHMCQSAQLAQKEGYDDEVILAAFFHDLGHLFAQGQAIGGQHAHETAAIPTRGREPCARDRGERQKRRCGVFRPLGHQRHKAQSLRACQQGCAVAAG